MSEMVNIYCWICMGRIISTDRPDVMGYLPDGTETHKHCRIAHTSWLSDWRAAAEAGEPNE